MAGAEKDSQLNDKKDSQLNDKKRLAFFWVAFNFSEKTKNKKQTKKLARMQKTKKQKDNARPDSKPDAEKPNLMKRKLWCSNREERTAGETAGDCKDCVRL